MKTLHDHVIIYDNECPMCDLYTNAFVKTKMLDPGGRKPFSETDLACIDRRRACDEIALVNMSNNTVLYGIDSLFAILQNRFSILKYGFQIKPVYWLMKHFYAFISYNRKVIAPPAIFERAGSCTPAFHAGYRWAYIIFAWLATAAVLSQYSTYVGTVIPPGTVLRELAICGGQILFQGVIVFVEKRERLLHYLGNMMTISLAGAMLLLPAVVIGKFDLIQYPVFFVGWFLVVVAWMLSEHIRRVRILEMPGIVTVSWVVYRLIVLGVVLFIG